MDSIDYKVGLSTDPNAQASLAALKQQLTDIYELSQKINASAINISGGVGGSGGGRGSGGGGGGGGGAAGRAAAGAAGLPVGGYSDDAFDEMMYGLTGGVAPAMAQATAAGLSSSKMSDSGRSMARAMGFQALAYGVEDAYMGGIGGVINNVPGIVHGMAANSGMDYAEAAMMATKASGVAMLGYMAYRNRDSIYEGLGITDSMSRENVGFMGVAAKTESEKAAKLASDADYYVNKYGAASVSGQRYMREGAAASVDAQLKATQEVNASQLAQTQLAPTTAEVMSASALKSLRVSEGDLRSVLSAMGVNDPEETATLTSRALGGDTGTLRQRAKSNPNDPLVNLSQNLSQSQRFQINQMRSDANNPYANLQSSIDQIRSILSGAGGGDQSDPIADAIGAEMAAQQRDAMTSPEEGLAENYGRYSRNIGAALGGIEMNSRSGGIRAAQVKNLQMRVYQDLLRTGMSPDQASQAAQSLYASGTNAYRGMVGRAQGNPQGFMQQMDQEQQMAFQMQNQTYNQVLYMRSVMRRNMMMRTRRSFRGAN